MAPSIEHLKNTASSNEICTILERDGAVIIDELLSPQQISSLNTEMDTFMPETGPGLRNPAEEEYIEFYGRSTVRFDGLPGKSATFLDIMLLPQLCETADHFVLPNCKDYILNTGQVIEIAPGETAQFLHRDEDAWKEMKRPYPNLQIEAMFALTDFTLANGATQVVPGSHLWPPDREPRADEVVQAEMPAGSALMYLGSAIHGGGANTTRDQHRRGMFLGYVVGWLRAEENSFLTVPMAKVRQMPVRIQELLGYKAHEAIGVVDVGSPMVLLR